MSQLVRLDAYYQIDEWNAVAVRARKIHFTFCPHGEIVGEWIRDPNDRQSGNIQGVWLDPFGQPFASMAGRFWTTEDGRRLFEGTYSGIILDVVLGYFKGEWYYDDPRMCPMCGEGHGRFKGHFTDMKGEVIGMLEGEFGDWSIWPDDAVMPMQGRWRVFCDRVSISRGED